MDAFVESLLDLGYDYGTDGGPSFSTAVLGFKSGREQRVANWANARGRWEIGDRTVNRSELTYLQQFFRARRGRAQGFRFKDWGDYQAAGEVLAHASGATSIQLTKTYADGGESIVRDIVKPVVNDGIQLTNTNVGTNDTHTYVLKKLNDIFVAQAGFYPSAAAQQFDADGNKIGGRYTADTAALPSGLPSGSYWLGSHAAGELWGHNASFQPNQGQPVTLWVGTTQLTTTATAQCVSADGLYVAAITNDASAIQLRVWDSTLAQVGVVTIGSNFPNYGNQIVLGYEAPYLWCLLAGRLVVFLVDLGGSSMARVLDVSVPTVASDPGIGAMYVSGNVGYMLDVGADGSKTSNWSRVSLNDAMPNFTLNGTPYIAQSVDSTTGLVSLSSALGDTDVLAWSGDFDLPARFDSDHFPATFRNYRESDGEALFDISSLPVVEILP